MKFDKSDIVRDFLLSDEISPEERTTRFEIAWEIREILDDIKLELRRAVFETVLKKFFSEEEFKNYLLNEENFTKGASWGSLWFLKPHWENFFHMGITYYKNFNGVYLGLWKASEKKPYKGNWREAKDLSPQKREILAETFAAIETDPLLGKLKWDSYEDCVAFGTFDNFYHETTQFEFYEQILGHKTVSEGVNAVAEYYISALKRLKQVAEPFIEKFIAADEE